MSPDDVLFGCEGGSCGELVLKNILLSRSRQMEKETTELRYGAGICWNMFAGIGGNMKNNLALVFFRLDHFLIVYR